MFWEPRPVVGAYGPIWQTLDSVGRAALLSEMESAGYRVVAASLTSGAPPVLARGSQTYYLFDPRYYDAYSHPLDNSGADGTGVRIGITKYAETPVEGIPLWWLAAGALGLLAIVALARR